MPEFVDIQPLENISSLEDAFNDILDFHDKFQVPIASKPSIPSPDRKALRRALLVEEFEETISALDSDDIVEFADGLVDLIVVAIGAAIEYGIFLPGVWEVVHEANMRKEGGGKREDGKILKPEGWEPPDVSRVLQEQRIII